MNKTERAIWTLCAVLVSTTLDAAEDEDAELADLELRLRRVEAADAIERLQSVYGYYQDRYLFDQAPTLFARQDTEAHYNGGIWTGAEGIERLWLGHFTNTLGQGEMGPIAGEIYDQPQMQGVIDVADDAMSATAQFRTLGRRVSYGESEEWIAGVYNNEYVFEDDTWKLKVFRYCTRWAAPYHEGWVDSSPVAYPQWETFPESDDGPDALESEDWQCSGRYPDTNLDQPLLSSSASPIDSGARAGEGSDTIASDPEVDPADLAALSQRAQRVADALDIERLHSVYGYQQDKTLFSEQVDLFADNDVYAIFQNGVYEETEGLRRLWYGHWSRLTAETIMLIDGFLNEHFFTQPVITIAEDGQTAQGRFRARDYVFNYTGEFPLPSSHKTAAEAQDAFHADGESQGAGPLNLIQDLIYENAYVKEDGIWKMQGLVICIYANGSYGRGYADLPVPGQMGNSLDAMPGERFELDVTDTMPEQSNELFPANPIGPNRVIGPEELGCYIGKSQVMSRSAVFPFHYENPVTHEPVVWQNRRQR